MQTLERMVDATEQILTLPITLRSRYRLNDISERFARFHAKYPEIYDVLVEKTR